MGILGRPKGNSSAFSSVPAAGAEQGRGAPGRIESSAISEQLSQQHMDKDVLHGPSPLSSNSLEPSSLQEQE